MWISPLNKSKQSQSCWDSVGISTHLISSHVHMLRTLGPVGYLHRNIQVDHEGPARSRPEEQVEVASCQPQRPAAAPGHQDEAAGRNRTPDPEHGALQTLVLGFQQKWT